MNIALTTVPLGPIEFSAPRTDNEYPFWLCQCGISSKTQPTHQIRLNSDVSCIQYVISGSGIINCNRHTHAANPGDTFLLRSGTDQNYYCSNGDHWERLWINFKGVLADELIKIYNLTDAVVFQNTYSLPILTEIYETIQTVDDPNDYKSKTTHLFLDLIQLLSKHRPKKQEDFDMLAHVRHYIDCHINEQISISDIAALAHRSPEYLIRTFKERYHITPHRYILESKMRLASDMLKNTRQPISMIAENLCFYDTHHFSAQFEKMIGCRPSVYRKNTRKKLVGKQE